MRVSGSHVFNASQDVVWQLLRDPGVLANVLPGCEELHEVEENRYQGVIKLKIGPIQGTFDGTVVLSDIIEPEACTLTVDGKGAPGFVKGVGRLRLEANGDTTTLHYEGDAQIGGRLASVGQRLIDSSTRAIIDTCLEGLDGHAAPEAEAEAVVGAGEGAVGPTPPSQAEFLSGVARRIAQDAVRELTRPKVVRALAMGVCAVVTVYVLYRVLGGSRRNRS